MARLFFLSIPWPWSGRRGGHGIPARHTSPTFHAVESVDLTKIETMFDSLLHDDVLGAVTRRWAYSPQAHAARNPPANRQPYLVHRPVVHRYGDWSCDNWDAMAAEVAAAQGISHGMASGQMYLASALRDRLPRVAALFAGGTVSARLAASIVWHTDLIKDPETLQLVDEKLAEDATRYGPLSANKTASYTPRSWRCSPSAADTIWDTYWEMSRYCFWWPSSYRCSCCRPASSSLLLRRVLHPDRVGHRPDYPVSGTGYSSMATDHLWHSTGLLILATHLRA